MGKSLKNKKVRAFDQPSTDHKKKKGLVQLGKINPCFWLDEYSLMKLINLVFCGFENYILKNVIK